MKKTYHDAVTRRKTYYVKRLGFKRRLPWRQPFSVSVYQRICTGGASA